MSTGTSANGTHDEGVSRSDIEALGATRSDLGADYEPALLDNFADKVEAAIDARVSAELARRGSQQQVGEYRFQNSHGQGVVPIHHGPPPVRGGGQQLALGIVSMAAFIPISIVLGIHGQFLPLVMTLFSIVAVNFAHSNLYKDKGRN
ncbi:hypothetical protein FOJ82_10325 [Tessaracoccus rhinocerotis]|uniref:Uncharacterized protein n=1 Tax=Tessaracoccus rhinocerotis TaxID=1689449 RepID=A0A553JYZ6_9ACTN|nr:hypothetical protein [Tessaracoccus rhinocerotis]TRY17675.1 hypothetical protein FOJ82_10325 [Tessaracoccus rhinocerotis]